MNKKKILAIVLLIVVLLLGGASIYVATQLSTRQVVAPTAPESRPAAADCTSLTTQATCDAQTTPDCTWFASCSKCANAGTDESTVCDSWEDTTKTECTLTGVATAVEVGDLAVTKTAYKNETTNTVGNYSLDNPITTVVPNQTFVYKMGYENVGTTTISSVILSDILIGNNLEKLSFVDADTPCTFDQATRKVSCSIGDVAPGKASQKSFRVKVSESVTDGMVIANSFSAAFDDKTVSATNSLTVDVPVSIVIEGSKTAYKNVTANTPGVYSLTTLMDTVSKSQIYVYSIELKNTSNTVATGVTIKDSLKNISTLTYMDTVSGCSYNTTEKEITCATSIQPDETKTFSFRVKAVDSIANGDVISNTAVVTYPGGNLNLTKDLTVSTIVSCNHTCTVDAECSNGLTCDTTTNKCRLATCATEEDCVCGVIATTTKAPTAVKTVAPTNIATAAATPSILPESGILDIPGVFAFGGGLLLAIVGILLAL